MPTVGSLFSGIGGLDLGLERAGWEVKWQVEIDEWCQKVLTKHWPDVPKYRDVRELKGADLEPVDLIAGGFPCQPVSCAGRRQAQADPRWLWPEFFRIVSEVRPRLVLVENVPGLLHRGMAEVIGDLSSCGYDTEWDCIPAAAVGAPHLRYRVFVVAYSQSEQVGAAGQSRKYRGVADMAHATGGGWHTQPLRCSRPQAGDSPLNADGSGPAFRGEEWWATEPDVGRVAHGVPSRVDRLRGLGNAVVPQVAEWLGRRLLEAQRPVR